MIKAAIIIIVLVVSTNIIGQTSDNSEVKFLTNESLTDSELKQIQDYNFEKYRKDNQSVIIQIVNGPMLELLAKKTISKQQVSLTESSKPESHEHVMPHEVDIKKVEIIRIDLFNPQKNVAK